MALGKKQTSDLSKASNPIVFAYGFDRAGFQCPGKPMEVPGVGTLRFVGFNDSVRLNEADGVIIPTGLFEQFEKKRDVFGTVSYRVPVFRDLLMEREKQVRTLLVDGKWVCFLVGELIDHPPGDYSDDASDTDLGKRLLNTLGVERKRKPDGLQVLDSLCPEFSQYVRDYGVAKTVFHLGVWHTVIAKYGDDPVAFEFGRKEFFLPFHTTNYDADSVADLVRVVAESVSKYRLTRKEEVPEWADEFQFSEELSLKKKRGELEPLLREMDEKIGEWKRQKSILVSSGDALRDRLVSILRDYFGLKIDPTDEHREDAKVLDEAGKTLVLLEAKASSGGVARKDVSQIGFHRDKAGTPQELSGVLIINCDRSLNTVAERLVCTVHADQIHYAKSLNVLIVRTIDLLFLMRQMEGMDVSQRRSEIMKLFCAGGGWLKADEKTVEVVG